MTTAETPCFHCGLPVPPKSQFRLQVDDRTESFCCPGCQAVAEAIISGGLENFYRFRTQNNPRPDERRSSFQAYDLLDVQAEFVHHYSSTEAEASLLLEGITCAACVWLIEHHIGALAGVISVRVNATTHRCLLRWNPEILALSELMQAFSHVGYQPIPAVEGQQQALRQRESRQALMRLGVAGFGMMQVGMVAVALYTGADDDSWQNFFRWLSFIIATPVVLFSARPFFSAARRALISLHLTMDVPVSIAIGGAYLASTWATVFGGGEVYFDSVSMFTFFLLWGRYLEMQARHRNGIDTDRLAQILPLTAERRTEEGYWQAITLKQLQPGDVALVKSGSCIPCDGRVIDGSGGVIESLITGEPDAVHKNIGDSVIAGTMNTDSPLQIEVTAVGQNTRLSAIERLVEQAQQEKPVQVALADRLASYFVAAVLLISLAVGLTWWQLDAGRAIWITLSILVVTCPCALSLASPTALTVAVSWLRKHGLLVTRGHVLEGLNNIDRVIFDKTGTLTVGAPKVFEVLDVNGDSLSDVDRQSVLEICASLETGSTHPIARAFSQYKSQYEAENIRQLTGQGVQGLIQDGSQQRQYRLGKPGFVCPGATPPRVEGQWLLFARIRQADGLPDFESAVWIRLQDQLRSSAFDMVQGLQQRGLQLELLSGDGVSEVERVAKELKLINWRANQSPDDKLAHIHRLQQHGERVMMVGDGINDVPVLSAAFVSVAMGGSTDLAQTRADSVLLSSDLNALNRAFECASLTRRIIRQNLGWALGYNLLALPLAALGWIPPWAAAIGMSTSSLVVVGNALRIGHLKTDTNSSG